jgi:hypothetical protein
MDWSNWYPLDANSIRQFCEQTSGVYMVRQKEGKFGRLNGSSDILYIGQSDKDLKTELLRVIRKGPGDHSASYRILPVIEKLKRHLEFSFAKVNSPTKEIQDQLLSEYEEEHFELPPLNRQGKF